jgi:hypothetical protein
MDEEYLHPDEPQDDRDLYTQRDVVRVTGDERVDGAVAALGRLPGLPADEHVAVLEEVHGQLRDILGELDDPEGRR